MQRQIEHRKCQHENDQHSDDTAPGAQYIRNGVRQLAQLAAVSLRSPCGRYHHLIGIDRHLALCHRHRALLVFAARAYQMMMRCRRTATGTAARAAELTAANDRRMRRSR